MEKATNTNLKPTAVKGSVQESRFLTFKLDGTEFGIEILKVVEILKMMEITTVPMWPAFARGIIDLRGKVIPVVDLRMKFGLSQTELTAQTCTIVVELGGNQIGVVVEAVSEVQEVPTDHIEPALDIGGTVETDYILGIGRLSDETVILLDLEKVLLGREMAPLLGGIDPAALAESDCEEFEPELV